MNIPGVDNGTVLEEGGITTPIGEVDEGAGFEEVGIVDEDVSEVVMVDGNGDVVNEDVLVAIVVVVLSI